MFLECRKNISNLFINEHHLIKKHQICCVEKINSTELYDMQLILKIEKPTTQTYFDKIFKNPELEWKDVYTLPRRVTINTNLHIFQHKLLNNILYLNEMLHFGEKVPPLGFFYMEEAESPFHLFHFCVRQLVGGGVMLFYFFYFSACFYFQY